MIIGIIGQGTMGAGIAQVAAQNGCKVIAYDTNQTILTLAEKNTLATLQKLVEKQKITEATKNEIIGQINYSSTLTDLADCDLIIEAIVENLDIKKTVFKSIEAIVKADCIIASNTSSLSITSIASACVKSDRVIGIHFFNPAPIMALVEIVPAIQTRETITNQVINIIANWGKTTVIAKDTPGFIVNRIARPYYSEALRIFDEGIASMEVIDTAMNLVGFKMGPFALMDMIGHDVNYIVTETVWKEMYYDARYKPSHTQKRLLEAGWLGKKTGRGFYNYAIETPKNKLDIDEQICTSISDRILLMLFNEAGDAAYMNVANEQDIEIAMTKGVNYPKGLLAWAQEFGNENVCIGLDKLYTFYGEDRYRCSPYFKQK